MSARLWVLGCIVSTGLALDGAALAQPADGWKLSGTMRLRYEAVDGQVRPGFNASDDLVNLRTTLLAEHRSGPLRLGLEIYDSRAWGADRTTPISTNEVNVLEPVQLYAAYDFKTPSTGAGSVQLGRMLLNMGSRRLVAADDYRNTTNSYTGVKLDFAPAGLRTSLIFVEPQVRLPDDIDSVLDHRRRLDDESSALKLWGGVVSRPKTLGPATLEGSYFHLEERDIAGRPTRDRSLDTFGARVIRDPQAGALDYEVEAIGQSGQISVSAAANAARQDVAAGFLHADLGYSFRHPWKPRLSGEFDWASGDKPGGRYNRFDTLFGMRRADLAPAGLYNAIGRANILTPGVRLEVTPPGAWDGFVAARGLWLAAPEDAFSTTGVRDASGRSGEYAGVQVEGRWRYWLVKDRLRAEVDALWLGADGVLEAAPNATRRGDETYLSLNLTAQF